MNLRALLLSATVLLSACQNMPEPYAPPEQRQPFENFRPYRISRVVNMADGDVESHIVSGITDISGGSWRWAEQRPESGERQMTGAGGLPGLRQALMLPLALTWITVPQML